jgi:hypothetical protein
MRHYHRQGEVASAVIQSLGDGEGRYLTKLQIGMPGVAKTK